MKKSVIYLICMMLAVACLTPGIAFGMTEIPTAFRNNLQEASDDRVPAMFADSLQEASDDRVPKLRKPRNPRAAQPQVSGVAMSLVADSVGYSGTDRSTVSGEPMKLPRFVFPVADESRDRTAAGDAVTQIGTVSQVHSAPQTTSVQQMESAFGVVVQPTSSRNRFLPMHRRFDRGINQGRFAYKGELAVGLSASYGAMNNDDTEFFVILENINLKGAIATVKPFIGYFYRDNRCLGVRFGYQHMSGRLGNVDLNLGELNDVEFSFGNMELNSDSYSLALFHRSYVGLDSRGRFGLFAEVEASMQTGTTDFINGEEGSAAGTYSDNFKIKLGFNPGLAVYIFPNVCATVSLGLGGIQYASVTQRDGDGNHIGSRKSSNMQFKINIFDINFGVVIHFWDKKKR